MPGPSLGTNLSGLVDWSTAFPFVNQFLMTRTWYTQTDDTFNTEQADLLDLDANGWVRGFTQDGSAAPFTRVGTIFNTSEVAPRPGVYVLDWQGSGTVEINGLADEDIVLQREGRIELRLQGSGPIQILITGTDPQGTGDYIRDMRLYHSQDADLLAGGQVFNPDFLARIEGFRSLRFMDWMETNNSVNDGVEDLRPEDAARQTGSQGASIEVMVALANQTHADPWFTIPHLADDAYIARLASYVRDHLAEGLVARFEYSNEVWNWGFDQAHWANDQAAAAWGEGTEGGWMQWYGVRAANMARIVAGVFGDETGSRALNVFSTQSGWQGLEYYALNAPAHVAAGGTAPQDAPFHVYAIAPYFGGSIGSVEMEAQVDGWIAQGAQGVSAALAYLRHGDTADSLDQIGSTIAYHAGVARAQGWQLEAYEGGQHVVDLAGLFGGTEDPARTAFFVNLVQHPSFAGLYADYFATWRDSGGGLMAQFSDFGPPSRYGSWGIWDSVNGPDTPRSLAVEAFRDQVAAWWNDPRPASTFADGEFLVDRIDRGHMSGGDLDDVLFGLGGDDLLKSGSGDDSLYGGTGADTLQGKDGDDLLFGAASDDNMRGGAGNDTLIGGAGNDRMKGNSGADVFVLMPGSGSDRIRGFDAEVDRIEIAAAMAGGARSGADLVSRFGTFSHGALRIDLPGGDSLVIDNFSASDLPDLRLLIL